MGGALRDFGGAAIAAGPESGKKDIKKSACLYLMTQRPQSGPRGRRPRSGASAADLGGGCAAVGHALDVVTFAAEQRQQPVLPANMGRADGHHRGALGSRQRLLQGPQPIAVARVDEEFLRLGTV